MAIIIGLRDTHTSPVFQLSQCGMSFRTDVLVKDSWNTNGN